MQDIFQILKIDPSSVSEEQLESISLDVLTIFQSKIDFLARKSYGFNVGEVIPTVVLCSFKEQAKTEVKNALYTFLFKHEYWKAGRECTPYLFTTLNRLSDRIIQDLNSSKKTNVLICPLCKELGVREFLISDNKLWRCPACTTRVEVLSDELKDNTLSTATRVSLEGRLAASRVFSLHSRKGYRCLECEKFIPDSANTSYGISCPFVEDCMFIGKTTDLELMAHPVTLCHRQNLSLQNLISDSDKGPSLTLETTLEAENLDADTQLSMRETLKHEYAVLCQVLDAQIATIKRTNAPSTLTQKLLMYEAYKSMVVKYPEEMISYLVHQKQTAEFPIQARIFQEYISLIENYLPFTMVKRGATLDIVDLTDPHLSLFLGVSKFEAVVQADHTIPNNTIETYTGGRQHKNYGPCFIGKIIDIVDLKTNISFRHYVKEYSFVNITMEDFVPIGASVLVSHFRISSHYQIGSLVHLQKIRRNIVDSVFFRLNKEKRIPKTKETS